MCSWLVPMWVVLTSFLASHLLPAESSPVTSHHRSADRWELVHGSSVKVALFRSLQLKLLSTLRATGMQEQACQNSSLLQALMMVAWLGWISLDSEVQVWMSRHSYILDCCLRCKWMSDPLVGRDSKIIVDTWCHWVMTVTEACMSSPSWQLGLGQALDLFL